MNFFQRIGDSPPAPIRGSKSKKTKLDDDEDGEIEEKESSPQIDLADLVTRVDISNQITESLLNELADKNWKVISYSSSSVLMIF